jgi:hypothetical protein
MARTTVELELIAIVSEATKAINSFSKNTQKQLNGISLNTTISAINDGFELIEKTAGRAFSQIKDFVSETIDEASFAEDAQIALANALRISGDFSENAVKQFNDLAASLQKTTKFSDEQVLSAVSIAKQYQLTNKEAEKAIKVSADLAARLGIDLNSATEKVSRTFVGFVDRDLARSIPGLKKLSQEALISGQAIDVIGRSVNGSAEALANTFNGALTRTNNLMSDFMETIGGLFVNNPQIIAGINQIGKIFEDLAKSVEKNKDELKKLVTEGFIALVDIIPAAIQAVSAFDGAISTIVGSVQSLILVFTRLPSVLLQSITGSTNAFKEFSDQLVKLTQGTGAIKRQVDIFDPLIKKTQEYANQIKNAVGEAKELNKEVANQQSFSGEEVRKKAQDMRNQIEAITKNPIAQLVKIKMEAELTANQKSIAASVAGVTSAVLKGAEGARQLVSSTVGAIADSIIPGIGGVVGEIVNVLSQGPDKVREMVQGFAKAIPELIKNLVDSLPVLITELARAMPQIAVELAAQMPFVAVKFATSLVSNIPRIIAGFAEEFLKLPGKFLEALLDAIPGVGSLFGGDNSTGIPIIGDVIDFVGDLLPFADGGRIPDSPKYAGDKGIVRVDAGEQILSRDLTNRLERFLSGGGSGQNMSVNLFIGPQQLAKAEFNLNRKGFRTA